MSSPLPQDRADRYRSRIPRIAEAAVERARLTVVPRGRTTAAKVPFVTLVSLLLLGGVIGLLLFNTSMQQSAFAASSLEEQASTLGAREQTLRLELDVLRDPQRVATQARELGMVPAASPAFLRLPDGKVLGEPKVAARSDDFRIAPYPPAKPAHLAPPPKIVKVPADTPKLHGDTRSTSREHGRKPGRNGSAQASGERSTR